MKFEEASAWDWTIDEKWKNRIPIDLVDILTTNDHVICASSASTSRVNRASTSSSIEPPASSPRRHNPHRHIIFE